MNAILNVSNIITVCFTNVIYLYIITIAAQYNIIKQEHDKT